MNKSTINAALLACLTIGVASSLHAETVYNEANGLVVMEMEKTKSSLGKWKKISAGEPNYVNGAKGSAHLEFTGNTINGGDPKSGLVYKFKINKSGTYYLNLRARKRLAGVEPDKCNDCWIKMSGDFTSGSSEYDSSVLKETTKLYGGSANAWGWATDLDSEAADHTAAIYNFKAGKVYTFTVYGRSIRFNADRIIFRHSSVTESYARSSSRPESRTTETSSGDLNKAIKAGSFNSESHPTNNNKIRKVGNDVKYITNNTWICFNSVDFASGSSKIEVRATTPKYGGRIEIRVGSKTGTKIGTVFVTKTGSWNSYKSFTANLQTTKGKKKLYLVFKGGKGGLFTLRSFKIK